MDDKSEPRLSRPPIEEILSNLLSCSENESPLKTAVHVYDPKELQSGWQPVICNAKYIACPEKRSPSVKSDPGSYSSLKQKRNRSKNKKNDSREDIVSEKFNKYESLGVLSYDVSSWRTIVDPETHTYIKRSHPCQYFTHSNGDGPKRTERVSFLDPAGAMDKHLGDFIKHQRANSGLVHNPESDVAQRFQNHGLAFNHRTEIHQPLRPLSEFRCKSFTGTQTPPPNPPPVYIKRPVINSLPKTKRDLSPLALSNNSLEQVCNKGAKCFPPSHQLRQSNKPSSPMSFHIINPIKTQKDKKLNWLPITSTTPCVQKNGSQNTDWEHRVGIPQNPVKEALNQLKYQVPAKGKIAVTSQLKPSIPCQLLELPLTLSGSN